MTKPSQMKSVSSIIIKEGEEKKKQIDLGMFLLWTGILITVKEKLAII